MLLLALELNDSLYLSVDIKILVNFGFRVFAHYLFDDIYIWSLIRNVIAYDHDQPGFVAFNFHSLCSSVFRGGCFGA